jgi:hypothetical protein
MMAQDLIARHMALASLAWHTRLDAQKRAEEARRIDPRGIGLDLDTCAAVLGEQRLQL